MMALHEGRRQHLARLHLIGPEDGEGLVERRILETDRLQARRALEPGHPA